MINLLLIDPQPVVRCGFKTFLSDFYFLNVLYVTEDINGAIDFIKSNSINVLIFEITFSDISPVKLIKKVKKTNPEIDVIFFTS